MNTRRDFLKQAALASAISFDAIQKAFAIEPAAGSSFLDAEHVVILMQENRSFDHTFGSLSGVRGFNDPRTIRLPDGNPVWVQSEKGTSYVPFRLDMHKSKTTWMGSLPHGWTDQVDAANGGKHDGWLAAKKSGHKEYAGMPLTLGFYTREDLPFYYALADAFTICDQNFCSTLTGTTPNRLHLWTGTIREKQSPDSPALVRNEDCDFGRWARWTTFPERLEDAGISWKIYQNELSIPTGLSGERDDWLANFTDNPIEWFEQYHVRCHPAHQEFLKTRSAALTAEIAALKAKPAAEQKDLAAKEKELARIEADRAAFSREVFDKLPPRERSLHAKAFTTNINDPAYRELTTLEYQDGGVSRKMSIPKGDILHQFRKDVESGQLPTVSWLVPPEKLSDHPSSAWYGSWYLSEVLSILTKNPDIWKKTIFILTYDENDGYYDHIPPFQAPHPKKPESGKASPGLAIDLEQNDLDVDQKRHPRGARGNALGLGFRVPMVVASPWSRGGCVCSQVFDHTSIIQLLEKLLSHKTGKVILEPNINSWRRAVCGDLTSAFQKAVDVTTLKEFQARDPFFQSIHKAQFEKLPTGCVPLTNEEIAAIQKGDRERLPKQEPGQRLSSPLPYELSVDSRLIENNSKIVIRFKAGKERFGARSAGVPYIVYAETAKGLSVRHYTVAPGQELEETWPADDYHLRIHGPNGFFRQYTSRPGHMSFRTRDRDDGNLTVELTSRVAAQLPLFHHYDSTTQTVILEADRPCEIIVEAAARHGWYDVSIAGCRAAGRVETGRWSFTDPFIS